MMFGTHNLSEDWNPNLNFMWVPCQIWEHLLACFWIQAGFKSGLNLCGFQFYYRYWAHVPFLPIFSLSPPDASLLLSLLSNTITKPLSLFITLGQTPTPLLITSPSHLDLIKSAKVRISWRRSRWEFDHHYAEEVVGGRSERELDREEFP